MSEQPNELIAPLVCAMLDAPAIKGTGGAVVCPICGCDHQIFQGTGCFTSTQDGGTLTCCFPATRTLVEIEMPKGVKVGGLVTYTRYVCGCNGHSWVFMLAYCTDHTVSWCADLTPSSKKKCGKSGQEPFDSSMLSSIQQLLQGMAAGGAKPILMLGPGITAGIPPEALKALQAQGAQLLQPGQIVLGQPPQLPMNLPSPQLGPDHEDRLVRLPATVRYAWQNWFDNKPLPDDQILNFQLPKLPVTHALKTKPPHMAVGTNDTKMLTTMQEWLFSVAVDVRPESKLAIHAMVYWENLLIVVSSAAKESRRALAKDIADTIIGLKKLKPDVYMMTRKDYSVLVSNKAAEAATKPKTKL